MYSASNLEQITSLIVSKFQFHNLNKVLHQKNQPHDMPRVVAYLLFLVQRCVGTDCG